MIDEVKHKLERIERVKEMLNTIESYIEEMQINELIVLQSDLTRVVTEHDPYMRKHTQRQSTDLINNLFKVLPSNEIVKELMGKLHVSPENIPNLLKNIDKSISEVKKDGIGETVNKNYIIAPAPPGRNEMLGGAGGYYYAAKRDESCNNEGFVKRFIYHKYFIVFATNIDEAEKIVKSKMPKYYEQDQKIVELDYDKIFTILSRAIIKKEHEHYFKKTTNEEVLVPLSIAKFYEEFNVDEKKL